MILHCTRRHSSETIWLSIIVLAVSAVLTPAVEPPKAEELQARIARVPAHPRLFWTPADEARVRANTESDPRLKAAWEAVRATAEHMLAEPPVVYHKEGRRLLSKSREALRRTMHLGFAYRWTHDERYAKRAMAEMEAMAGMGDWNPSHFLDTAEMTLAMAVGYDWVYDQLTPEVRKTLREAIEQKGLGPYLKPGSRHWWERGGNNWNQVCHAGMTAGALVLAEENPRRAAEVVSRALAGLPAAMKVYDPDGTYPEGPGYWNYGTTFNVLFISMLESALGTDFGVSRSPGFLKTGELLLQIMGPSGNTFDYSDCGSGTGFSPAMVWFAARTGHPEWLWYEWSLLAKTADGVTKSKGARQGERYFPLILVWASGQMERKTPETLHWLGRGENSIAVLRGSWTNAEATYVAIKGGTPSASHGHMDVGSFVLDARGVRWSLDLGAEDYNKMEQRGIGLWNHKQGSDRWRIFRYHNRSHSTLLVNDAEQVVAGRAPITEFSNRSGSAYAVVDLSEVYAGQLRKAVRRFSLNPDQSVTIEDTLTGADEPATVRWGMTTAAALQVDGARAAWLARDGKRLRMEVASPKSAVIQAWPADPPPHDFDARNPGISVVGFTTAIKAGEQVALKVTLRPE